MEEHVMSIMKRATVFMIVAQAVLHFRPNASYEKYFRFLTGIMTVVILVMPMMEVVRSGISQEYEARLEDYMERLQEAVREDITIDMSPSQAYLATMEREIKSKLNNNMGDEKYTVDSVEMEVQPGEEEADAYRLKITLRPKQSGVSEIKVDKIEVAGGGQERDGGVEGDRAEVGQSAGSESDQGAEEERAPESERLREAFARLLEIERERVEVNIIE